MDAEMEIKVKEEIKKAIDYLFWKTRDTAGEFPTKIRVDCFFARNDGRNFHMIESEVMPTKEAIADAEISFQEWLDNDTVEAAKKIMTGES